jgi:hypothetical protein
MSFTADKESTEALDLTSALPSTVEAPSLHEQQYWVICKFEPTLDGN